MKPTIRTGRRSPLILLAGLLMAALLPSGAQQTADTSHQFSSAAEEATQPPVQSDHAVRLDRMILLLNPGPAREQALDSYLEVKSAGDKSRPSWVTPSQFAARFSLGKPEADKVAAWLRSKGFKVAALPAGRGWIEFSGTEKQVAGAFMLGNNQLESRAGRYQINGTVSLPPDIAPLVRGIGSLDGALSTVASGQVVSTDPKIGPAEAVAAELVPQSLDKALDLSSSSSAGSGQTIAFPSRSNVLQQDFSTFRQKYQLPQSDLLVQLAGEDPGPEADEPAMTAAVSWAGAAAPGARVLLVPARSTNATDGVDLALAAIVDGALAQTVAVEYVSCEAALSPGHLAFLRAIYRQAAAEGIAVVAAAGDSGAAACHDPGDATPITTGRAVNAYAATPWNTAVGAATLDSGSGRMTPWTVQAGEAAAGSTAALPLSSRATGGGVSSVYPTPSWQVAAGLPGTETANDSETGLGHFRAIPDLVMAVAAEKHGAALCPYGKTGCSLSDFAGSGVSAAIFAGIAARIAEAYGPQGNLAPNFYVLHSMQTVSAEVFRDIDSGDAQLACAAGSPDCTNAGAIGYSASPGFDLVTGLGSIRADTLVADWLEAQATGTAADTVVMTNTGGVTYNPTANITLSAKVSAASGSKVPTGTVQFYDETTAANVGTAVTLATDGTASYIVTGQFTTGGHNIQAQYSGDDTFKAAVSQPVTINVQPSPTSLTVAPSTKTPAGGSTITVTGTVIATNIGATPPTGTFTVNLDGVAQGSALVATTGGATSASVMVTVPASGSHTIQGTYSGDANYNNATSPSVTIAVAKAATVTTLSATPATLTAGTAETFTATIVPVSADITNYSITGTVSFYDAGKLLGTAPVTSNTAILTGVSLSSSASHTITANYSGDSSFSASVSSPLLLSNVLAPVTVTLVASNGVLAPGQPITLTATITPVSPPPATAEQHPSGYVLFYANSTLISSQVPVVVGAGNSGVASTTVPHLTAGQYSITAVYSGDPTYGPATSNAVSLAVEDFTVSCSPTSINIAQGTTQNVTCAVASLGGLTGPIQLVCEEQNPPQNGAITCTFSPPVINGSGSSNLSIVTTKGTSTAKLKLDQNDRSRTLMLAGGAGLALTGLFVCPLRRRARLVRSRLVNSVTSIVLFSAMLGSAAFTLVGCSNTVTVNTNIPPGTPLGVHTLKITAAEEVNTVSVSHVAYVTVNVTP